MNPAPGSTERVPLTRLQQWLKENPRGAARYRADGSAEFFSYKDSESCNIESDGVTAAVKVEVEGEAEEKEEREEEQELEGDKYYQFPRIRPPAGLRKKFHIPHPPGESSTRNIGQEELHQQGEASNVQASDDTENTSLIQHGDIIDINYAYRGVGYYIAYGPPDDMWFIKTGSEDGYCLPLEFCDAPPEYYAAESHTLHQFAFPSPALLFNMNFPQLSEAKKILLAHIRRHYDMPEALLEAQRAAEGRDRVLNGADEENFGDEDWMWEGVPEEPFAADGVDGFLVLNSLEGMAYWLVSTRPGGVASRYAQEVFETPYPVSTFGIWNGTKSETEEDD
jgi:hypothetical protein